MEFLELATKALDLISLVGKSACIEGMLGASKVGLNALTVFSHLFFLAKTEILSILLFIGL